ncbi:DNA-directed RNA polymerase, mitochondrial [Geodia barretti]|uniref:DNA-directed RNA polymerase, mitochondrial n=3 Tax=Geodia barretti TaxID=519541 RepID=A0AA35S0E4_GEOBA|nr:DNA-directed RNA polymerase, mitochondrial [Geodia barretti]
MFRLVRCPCLRFSQLRLLSAKARRTRPSAAEPGQGDREPREGAAEGTVPSVSVPSTSVDSGGSRSAPQTLSLHDSLYISSLLDAYLGLGMVSEAELVFNRHRREGHTFPVSVYNKILQSWVKKGSQLRAVMLFESMVRDGVDCNAQTHAIMLVLHTRRKNWDAAKKIVARMESEGYPLKHILQMAQLSKTEAAEVLKAMDHFRVSAEKLPRQVGPYPRVVRSLYDDWSRESDTERPGEVTSGEEKSEERLGVGVASVKVFSPDELKDRLRRQLQMEQQGYLSAPSIAAVHKTDSPEEEALKESTHRLMRQWRRDLTAALKRDNEDFKTVVKCLPALGSKFFGPKQYPFLLLLPAEVWADIVVEEVVVHILGQQQGLPLTFLCRLICDSAWHKYVVLQKKQRGVVEKTSQLYQQFMSHLATPSPPHLPHRQLWQDMDDALASAGSLSVDIPKWPFTVASYVGAGLLSRLIDTAKLSLSDDCNGEAAFFHSYEAGENGWQAGHVKGHQKLFKLFKKYYIKHESTHFRLAAELTPMLIPPRPWSQVNEGGYFVNPVSIMRSVADVYQHHSLLQQAPNLNAVFDSLNVLGTCSWRINTRILDLVTEIFNRGGNDDLGVPVRDPVFPE